MVDVELGEELGECARSQELILRKGYAATARPVETSQPAPVAVVQARVDAIPQQ